MVGLYANGKYSFTFSGPGAQVPWPRLSSCFIGVPLFWLFTSLCTTCRKIGERRRKSKRRLNLRGRERLWRHNRPAAAHRSPSHARHKTNAMCIFVYNSYNGSYNRNLSGISARSSSGSTMMNAWRRQYFQAAQALSARNLYRRTWHSSASHGCNRLLPAPPHRETWCSSRRCVVVIVRVGAEIPHQM